MRSNIKQMLVSNGWELGIGEYVATKKIDTFTLYIEYHRVRGYSIFVKKGGEILGDKWSTGYLDETLRVASILEKLIGFKVGVSSEAVTSTEPLQSKVKNEQTTVNIKRRGRPAKVKIATVS